MKPHQPNLNKSTSLLIAASLYVGTAAPVFANDELSFEWDWVVSYETAKQRIAHLCNRRAVLVIHLMHCWMYR